MARSGAVEVREGLQLGIMSLVAEGVEGEIRREGDLDGSRGVVGVRNGCRGGNGNQVGCSA